jgi:hypothetical protein
MMKEVYRYDDNGIYIEPVILKDGENIPVNCTEIKPTRSFYKGKFENGQWFESLTQAEIDELKNVPQPVSELGVEEKVAQMADQLVITQKQLEASQEALDFLLMGGM